MSFLSGIIKQLFDADVIEQEADLTLVSGGCIHQAGVFSYGGSNFFLKWSKNSSTVFEAEAQGLKLLRVKSNIHIPRVIGYGVEEGMDFLCLEFVESGSSDSNFWKEFGQSLAQLHQISTPHFGLDHDNFIGSLTQSNTWKKTWVKFFIEERLIPQLDLARANGLVTSEVSKKFESLYGKLGDLIPKEPSALLHGDLWSGNFLVGRNNQPVIFDPAVYFGHREAELAFTKLFGGFNSLFYQSYQEMFPLQKGYEERIEIFNLYPLLVHVNLFGSSYLNGVESTLRRFA